MRCHVAGVSVAVIDEMGRKRCRGGGEGAHTHCRRGCASEQPPWETGWSSTLTETRTALRPSSPSSSGYLSKILKTLVPENARALCSLQHHRVSCDHRSPPDAQARPRGHLWARSPGEPRAFVPLVLSACRALGRMPCTPLPPTSAARGRLWSAGGPWKFSCHMQAAPGGTLRFNRIPLTEGKGTDRC